ncbi:hypothetical protein BG003_001430 [Podila horticola]|nr:hypothetical protein BG003_001430 [Podila horticola]
MLSGWSPKASITNMTAVSGRTYWNAAAVDPSTRKVYVPNGITQKEAGNDVRYMLEYDVASGASKPISQSGAGNLGDLQDYVVVWSTSLNKLLAYGGRSNATTFNLNLYAYTPSADQWQILETVGNNPGGRGYFCMIPAYGGSKFVVFGGFGPNPTLADHSDVFVLDVSNPATLAWTKLADDQGNNYRRGSSACAVDHDLFIAWGGGTNGVPVTKNTTMVFNLTSNQWITEFKPSAVPVKSEPKNLAAIAGGSVGGVALVAVAVTSWIVYRQRSRTRFTQPEDQFKDAAGQDILLGQQPQRHQDQGHVQHSGRADDYESSAMSTVDETPGSKQSPLRVR